MGLEGYRPLHHFALGQGPPLLLLHGLFDSLDTWEGLIPHLSHRFKIYAVDLPGFGKTPLPSVWTESISGMVKACISFLDTHKLDKVSLVGNSMGGGLALALAERDPERINRVVLLNPYGLPTLPLAVKNARKSVMGRVLPYLLRRFAIRQCAKLIFSRSLYDQTLLNDQALNKLIQPFSSLQQRKNLFRFLRSISPEEISTIDKDLPRIGHGVLILWGEKDRWLSDNHCRRLEKRLRNVTVIRIPKCGHLPQMEKPDAVAAAMIPFLSK